MGNAMNLASRTINHQSLFVAGILSLYHPLISQLYMPIVTSSCCILTVALVYQKWPSFPASPPICPLVGLRLSQIYSFFFQIWPHGRNFLPLDAACLPLQTRTIPKPRYSSQITVLFWLAGEFLPRPSTPGPYRQHPSRQTGRRPVGVICCQ